MTHPDSAALGTLGQQSLRRPLEPAEMRLAAALETIFATGRHDFEVAVAALQEMKIPRPSGATSPWTVQALEEELRSINGALDQAYLERGTRPAGG